MEDVHVPLFFLNFHDMNYLSNQKISSFQQLNAIFILFSDNSITRKKPHFWRRQKIHDWDLQ